MNKEPAQTEEHMSDREVFSLAQNAANPEEMAIRIKTLRDEGKISQRAYTIGTNLLKLPTEEQIQEARECLKQLQVEEESKKPE